MRKVELTDGRRVGRLSFGVTRITYVIANYS
jgi:hypothetical protein